MENTNEGTVTISLQRYKELEGYEKDSLNLIAEVVAPYEAKVEDLTREIELLKIVEERSQYNEKMLGEYASLMLYKDNTIRRLIEEKSTELYDLRKRFENEKDILLSKHEGVVRLQREEIEHLEKSTRVITTIMTLIGVVIGVISTLIIQTIF